MNSFRSKLKSFGCLVVQFGEIFCTDCNFSQQPFRFWPMLTLKMLYLFVDLFWNVIPFCRPFLKMLYLFVDLFFLWTFIYISRTWIVIHFLHLDFFLSSVCTMYRLYAIEQYKSNNTTFKFKIFLRLWNSCYYLSTFYMLTINFIFDTWLGN